METFVKTKLDELSGRASLLTRNLARAKELVSRSGDREDEAERLRQALYSLRTEAGAVLATTVRLDGYIRLNAVALDKAAKKFDKVTGQSMRDWVSPLARRVPADGWMSWAASRPPARPPTLISLPHLASLMHLLEVCLLLSRQ